MTLDERPTSKSGSPTHPAPRLSLRGRIIGVYVFLLALNAGSWGLTILVSRDYPILLATGVLAFSFGLRHGVDADHIAAIDNATRKLMQDGQRPAAAGLLGPNRLFTTG